MMKVFYLLVAIFLLIADKAVAQYGDLIRIRAGREISDEFPKKLRYRYEQFQPGKIVYASGKMSGNHRFNYDLLLEVMLIIEPTRDTLILADQPDFKYFIIKEDTFFHAGVDRYVEVLAGYSTAKLAMREAFLLRRRDKKSDDGYASTVDQTNSVRSTRNMGYGRMIYDQDILMAKAVFYYLVDKEGNLHHANKSKFLKVFPNKKKSIQDYIDRTGTDFRSKEDLIRLFEYCIE